MTPRPDDKPPLLMFAAAALLGIAVLGGGLWYKLHQPAPTARPAESEPDPGQAMVKQLRPEFALAALGGAQRAVKEWDGKVLVVTFWATRGPHCKREITCFFALQQEFGAAGLQFIGVAGDDHGAVQDYVRTTRIDYPVLVGAETHTIAIAEQYGNLAGVMPYTVIVDRSGRIAYVHYGELHEDLARQVISSLL